jgi:hypothetical protein
LARRDSDAGVAPSAFQVVAGDRSKNEADKLKIGLNKEQLQQAATFDPYRPPATTTGMAPRRTGAPRPTAFCRGFPFATSARAGNPAQAVFSVQGPRSVVDLDICAAHRAAYPPRFR